MLNQFVDLVIINILKWVSPVLIPDSSPRAFGVEGFSFGGSSECVEVVVLWVGPLDKTPLCGRSGPMSLVFRFATARLVSFRDVDPRACPRGKSLFEGSFCLLSITAQAFFSLKWSG
jgi:hypothetical protein